MTRRVALALALSGLASACAGLTFGYDAATCEVACAFASQCGFLPSALGFGDSEAAAAADCKRLCENTPSSDDFDYLLGCLDRTIQPEASEWCSLAAEEDAYEGCAAAAKCIRSDHPNTYVLASVELEVLLISFADYEDAFGIRTDEGEGEVDGAAAALYAAPGASIESCTAPLCGRKTCMQDQTEAHSCRDTMCRKEPFQIGKTCDDLGATAIDILIDQNNSPAVHQALLDASTTSGCTRSSVTFDSVQYRLGPGPTRAYARVAGVLPAAELAAIDYPIGDAAPDDLLEYCVVFSGMDMVARGGDGLILVPIGDIAEIAAYLNAQGVNIPPCQP